MLVVTVAGGVTGQCVAAGVTGAALVPNLESKEKQMCPKVNPDPMLLDPMQSYILEPYPVLPLTPIWTVKFVFFSSPKQQQVPASSKLL